MQNHSWIEIITSVDGSLSHKRIITILAFLLFVVAFITDMVADIQIDEVAYWILGGIISGGMGFSLSEHFSKTKK